ncbi:MAG: hypothetical protein HY653_05520 [Acidobacteria bacterium]|nr:hypothetical protein [Acidobacteriota bacterium]
MKVRLALALLLGTILLAAAPAAFAQGCAICRNTAAAGGAEVARALDHGVLVLLVPTISIFVGIVFFAFRYRK